MEVLDLQVLRFALLDNGGKSLAMDAVELGIERIGCICRVGSELTLEFS